ncbi:MAG: glycosyltransferase family 87 protein [Chloroflexota bacterium]
MLPRTLFTLKVVVGIFAFMLLLLIPVRSEKYIAGESPTPVQGWQGFLRTESTTHPGEGFLWAGPEASLQYPRFPRYSPLNLHLKINLQRLDGLTSTRIEVYENVSGGSQIAGRSRLQQEISLVAVVESVCDNPLGCGTRDFYLTIPPRSEGLGLRLEFKSEVGFGFLEAELSLPPEHFFYLFWPQPFWAAGLLLLFALATYARQAGLNLTESLLLTSLTGFVLVTITPTTYQRSWWLLLLATALCWMRLRPLMLRPLILFLAFLLLSQNTNVTDIEFYFHWSSSVHTNGLWNLYNYDPTYDYLPLMLYLLYFYNLVVYPLGLEASNTTWRVAASLMALAVVALVYRISRKTSQPEDPGGWVLLAFNAAFFYNPAIWGQSDMLAVLALTGSFYLIYRERALSGGLALGLTAISKPQAWFVLPLLVWLLITRCGWRRASVGLGLGGGLAFVLAAIAFGLDFSAVGRYLTHPELAGENNNLYPTALNLNYLVLGSEPIAPPLWLSLVGFGVVGGVLLLVLYLSDGSSKDRFLIRNGLGAALLVVTCFGWLIKMKERYLVFGFPFLAIAALQNRRLFKPFLALSWLQLLQLVISLDDNTPWQELILAHYPYLWSSLLSQNWLRELLSIATLGLFCYLMVLYFQLTEPPPTKEDAP